MSSLSNKTNGILINVEPKNDSFSHYLWIVNPFDTDDYSNYVSPDFEFLSNGKNIWSLDIFLSPAIRNTKKDGNDCCEKINVCSVFGEAKKYFENPDVKVRIEICIAGVKTKEEKFSRHTSIINSCSMGKKYELCSFDIFDPEKSNNFQDDSVSRVLVVDFTVHLINHEKTDMSPNISNDFRRLLKNENLSDLVIVAEKEIIHVHKAVLAARSPVFLAMLETDMKERKTNRIEIPDIALGVILKLLEYMYTDKIEDLEIYAESLLGPSEQYQLEGLKAMCSIELERNLTMGNAIDTLVLADLYKAHSLKSYTLKFIARHRKLIEKMPKLDSLDQSYPHLLREILISSSRC